MPPIKILIVADGIFRFMREDPTDFFFTVHFLVHFLQSQTRPLILVDTAHREGDSDATITTPFNFATTLPDLAAYDEIWMLGYDGSNFGGSGRLAFVSDDEIAAIATFMDNGGGVLAVGDHDGLGSLMCGKIPRVRTMRKWFSNSDSDPTIPAGAPRNWPGFGRTRADTLVKDKNGLWNFDNQSDDLPQTLQHPGGIIHPLLQGSAGPINTFPDHMHEGEVLGYGGIPGREPWNLDLPAQFAGQSFVEYPTVNGHREVPTIIATGKVTGNHETTLEGSSLACESANFQPDTTPTLDNQINILSVYDGHNVGVGRVVTDSSFHHYLDLNITGDPCGMNEKKVGFQTTAGKPHLQAMQDFFRNLAIWLAGPKVSALSCLSVDGTNPILFYIHGDKHVTQAAWTPGHWIQNPVLPGRRIWIFPHWNKTILPSRAREGSTLASIVVHGTEYRVYYVDTANKVNELAWTSKHWVNNVLPSRAVTENSPLSCFAVNGNDSRVYYVDTSNTVNELSWTSNHWVNSPLPSHPTRPASPIASFGLAGSGDPRVYYIDTNDQLNELAWVGHWVNNRAILPSHLVLPDSGLTAFAANGTASRVYYMDNFRRANTLAWGDDGVWRNGALTTMAGNVLTGQYGGAMACFADGTDPRVFYVNDEVHVAEIRWNGSAWTGMVLPGEVARRPAAMCAVVLAGGDRRVYYLGEDERINECRWDGTAWTNRVV